jgi:hypothetical protein
MQNAMWLASIFGPLLIILGVWMLFYHDNMVKICASVKNTPSVLYVLSLINMLLGLTILTQFNVWVMGLSILVTLLGWFLLLRGIMALFVPQMLMKWSHDPSWMKVKGIVPLVWGFGLCWFAYWMQ